MHRVSRQATVGAAPAAVGEEPSAPVVASKAAAVSSKATAGPSKAAGAVEAGKGDAGATITEPKQQVDSSAGIGLSADQAVSSVSASHVHKH